jgi:uncharacterized membrane protein YhaH (DUF805 family)
MTFGQAISSGFQNYVNFTGRTPRSGFWYWILFYVIVFIVTGIIDRVAFPDADISPLASLAWLALLLPNLSVGARRLHDTDRSGWFLLLSFIPLIGIIILIVWWCQRGTSGPNRFGPDPLAGAF